MKKHIPLIAAAALLTALAPFQTRAALNTWTSATDSTWTTNVTHNWTSPTNWVNGDDAVFGATGAGAVSITDFNVAANSVTFNAPGYTLNETIQFAGPGGNSQLTLTGIATITNNANTTISAPIVGTSGLTIRSAGSLTNLLLIGDSGFGIANGYSGGTFIRSGTVTLAAQGVNSGGGAPLSCALNGLDALDAGAIVRFGVTYSALPPAPEPYTRTGLPNGQFAYDNGNQRLNLTGGTLDLYGDNNNNRIPMPSGTGTIINGSPVNRAVLKMEGFGTNVFYGIIANGGVDLTPEVNASNYQLGNPSTNGMFRMDIDCGGTSAGNALFIIAGPNTYSGSLRISAFPVQMTNGGTLGIPQRNSPNITLRINGSNTGVDSSTYLDLNGTRQITGGIGGNGGTIKNDRVGTVSVLVVGAADLGGFGMTNRYVQANGNRGPIQTVQVIVDNSGVGGRLGITKIGTNGLVIMNDRATYSGWTTISNGVIAFINSGAGTPEIGMLSPNTSLRLFTGKSELALVFPQTHNVAQAFVNDIQVPVGSYTAGQAPFGAILTGAGTLNVVGAPAAPVLAISKSGSNATISWTGDVAPYKLQSRASLSTGSWSDVVNGTLNPLVVPVAAGPVFYRLYHAD